MDIETTTATAAETLEAARAIYTGTSDDIRALAPDRAAALIAQMPEIDQRTLLMAVGEWTFGNHGTIPSYLDRAVSRSDLKGVVQGEGATIATNGITALVVPGSDDSMPLIEKPYGKIASVIRKCAGGQLLASTTISGDNLKLLGDMLGAEGDNDPVHLQLRSYSGTATLVASNERAGMVVMPLYHFTPTEETAPLIHWLGTPLRPEPTPEPPTFTISRAVDPALELAQELLAWIDSPDEDAKLDRAELLARRIVMNSTTTRRASAAPTEEDV